MGQILSALIALFKAFPAMKQAWDDLVSMYVQQEVAKMKKENREAIKKALETHDQRPIEELLGNQAGEHSGLTDSEEREELPDVKNSNNPNI